MNRLFLPSALLALAALGACSPLSLRPADFSWPIQVVLNVDSKGMASEDRYKFSVNVKELLYEETHDSTDVKGVELRMIRDARGYYFVTGEKFKNVYVFSQGDGALRLETKISVSEKGLNNPAFNQRAPNIQLVSEGEKSVMLTRDGVQQGGK